MNINSLVLGLPDDIWVSIINNLLNTYESEDWLFNVLGVCKGLNNLLNLKIKPTYIPFDIFIPLKNIIGKWSVYEFDIPEDFCDKNIKYIHHLQKNWDININISQYLYSSSKNFITPSTSKGLLYLYIDISSICLDGIICQKSSINEKCLKLRRMYLTFKKNQRNNSFSFIHLRNFLLCPIPLTFNYIDKYSYRNDTTLTFKFYSDSEPFWYYDPSSNSSSEESDPFEEIYQ